VTIATKKHKYLGKQKSFATIAGLNSGRRRSGSMKRLEEFKTFTALLAVIVIWLFFMGLIFLFDRGKLWVQTVKRKRTESRGSKTEKR